MAWPVVTTQPSFAELDRRVLARWRERDVFQLSLRRRANGPVWSFYEGPPTANGRPGVHHVEARVFKDVFPRYRTMKGFLVPRKAGWDCHGLPVELEVERELGLDSKPEIEDYGVAAFNQRCRESVLRYVRDFEDLTERIGFWVDVDDAYRTMDPDYVESVWWALERLWDQGLIFQDHRVTPYCPRCGTGLSDAEVALGGYREVDDPSVFVRLPLTDGPLAERGASLLVWTTTPWTLPSNAAVAIGPDIDYVLADGGEHGPLVVAAERLQAALGETATALEHVAPGELVGAHYDAPFTLIDVDRDQRYVVASHVVTTSEGSGLVHMAPAFGADDLEVGRREGLPVVNPVDTQGRFSTGPWKGRPVKEADQDIIAALERLGVLVRAGTYRHAYPFCWRCRSPLIYYAKLSWYIRTTARREQLLAENARIDWHPAHIRDGRFGNWLEHNVDWALSRDRYWGTPLPFWRCRNQHVTVVGSRGRLGELAGRDLTGLDPHRPYVDEVTFDCPDCGERAARVEEVADAWFDSGAMPFAQFGYPHRGEEQFAGRFPADFIAEAIDQTRGWFYTLLVEGTLLFAETSYRTVLCLGHIVDEQGRKMSKSLGNVLDPWELLDRSGADAMRWLMLAEGNPWTNRRVGPHLLDDIVRRFLLTMWNTHSFFATYARIDGYTPDTPAPAVSERHLMDRWVLAELADAVVTVDGALERYDVTTATERLERFVADLSNWYVRRSRRRFWKAVREDPADKAAAYSTLHTCLVTLAGLLAPFTPFVADQLWEDLVRSQDPSAAPSVHLTDFPIAERSWRDEGLRAAMAIARRVVELGRQARQDSGVRVRQPLPRALVTVPESERAGLQPLLGEVADELNVKSVELSDAAGQLVERRLTPNFRALGPAFQRDAPQVADALRRLDHDAATALARELAVGTATLDVGGRARALTPDMVEVVETPRTGWQLASEGATSCALDTTVTEELRIEGLARELVRAVNDRRKELDLAIEQRIALHLAVSPAEVEEALARHDWLEVVAHEVLAEDLHRDRRHDAVVVQLDGNVTAAIAVEPLPAT
ncbi:MAG TPA: isoleucine--tRNA ligase [Nitriliruptorales bacterium]|nr:isoleucine--tRNA ligase [Nitriliruptorales bacterium]